MGPFSGSPRALPLFLCLTNSFSGGNKSFCIAELRLPAGWMGASRAGCSSRGWSMEQALPHHCSLTATRMGKGKTGAIPSPQISAGAVPDKPTPNPASSHPPCSWGDQTWPSCPCRGSGHLRRNAKGRGKKIPQSTAALIAGKKFPSSDCLSGRGHIFCRAYTSILPGSTPLIAAEGGNLCVIQNYLLLAGSPSLFKHWPETLHFSSIQGYNLRSVLLLCAFPSPNGGYAHVPPALAAGTEEGNLSKLASLLVRKTHSSLGSRCQTNS